MPNSTKKLVSKIKNKTKRSSSLEESFHLTDQQRDIICKSSANKFQPFEAKTAEVLKKNGIDIESSSYNIEKLIVKDLKTAVNPKGVQPNDDFYSYINDRWIGKLELEENQKYIVQVDDFRLVQDKVYRELIGILEDYIKHGKRDKQYTCIKNAFESFQKFGTRKQYDKLVTKTVKEIDHFIKANNPWGLFAGFNLNEITSWGAPFMWSINPDDKNPKIFKCYLEAPKLSLVDVDIYFDDPEDGPEEKKYKNKYRRVFFEYLDNLFTLTFGAKHGFNVKDVYDCEFDILNAMICDLIKDVDPDDYNIVTKDEAAKNLQFDWTSFCKELGFKKVPNEFITTNINYLLCGTKMLLENWTSEKWRTYWIYIYIRQQSRWLQEGQILFFNFYGKFLHGQDVELDPYIRPVFGMGFTFNTFLTQQYVLRYRNEQAVNYVTSIAEDLKTVFLRIIKRNKWMQPKTKRTALEKLKTFKLTIGSPPDLREDPLFPYKNDDPWHNLEMAAEWRHAMAVLLVDKPVIDIPVIDWTLSPPKFTGTQAYIVNAMYTPSENGIYIPLGYIQKPFVDLDERGIEYNLSRIGFTIGHEMSHALDDWGSKYNEYGVLHDWWTPADKKAFKKIQEDVVNQYETYAKYDGIDFDAWPSIGEDIADISGFSICQEYLRDFQLKNEDILPIQSVSFEAFFIYFAVQSRQKISKNAILAQLKTNPHPLDKYRCNVPLSRTRVFRAIYDVKEGDKMWWHSLSNIWGE